MSTNYYAYTKNRKLVYEHFDHDHCQNEFEIVDYEELPDFGYLIHIGKRSCGWKPLFEQHPDAYSSIRTMLSFYKEHAEDFRFYDEYFEELPIEKLKDELIDWEQHQLKHRGVEFWKKTGPRDGSLEQVEEGEPYDIVSPWDHVEYEKLFPYPYKHNMYSHDEGGYDWSDGPFS